MSKEKIVNFIVNSIDLSLHSKYKNVLLNSYEYNSVINGINLKKQKY